MELQDVKKPVLYSAKQVKEFMGISYNTLYRLIHANKLKAIKYTGSGNKGQWRFRAEDIQEYYDSVKNPPVENGGQKIDQ